LVKDKSLEIKPRDASPRDPEKAIKSFSARNKRDLENNKQDLVKRIGGLIMSQPIRVNNPCKKP
jgi:hypothetical protein